MELMIMNMKPCPFCGNTDHRPNLASSYAIETEKETRIKFVCNRCHASGPNAINENDANEGWNQRKNDDNNNCPFCNSKEREIRAFQYKGESVMFAVSCANCNATGPYGESEDDAKGRWSSRNSCIL
jgi:Lar family restriction alleviation protein